MVGVFALCVQRVFTALHYPAVCREEVNCDCLPLLQTLFSGGGMVLPNNLASALTNPALVHTFNFVFS